MSATTLAQARDAAQKARQLSHDHQRAHRDADPADGAIAARGIELRLLADQATATHEDVERTTRAAGATRRRIEQLANDAGLQGRLRAEAQVRRDEAARPEAPPPRRRRGLS